MNIATMTLRSIVSALCLLAAATLAQAQPRPQPVRVELPFRVLSAEQAKLPKPLRFGGVDGKAVSLQEAFFVRLEVSAADYSAMSGDMEPFLYIGGHELRPYAVERQREGRMLTLTYFSRTAPPVDMLRADAPMVLTLDHGRPQREPEHYRRRTDLPRFKIEWMRTPQR
jgi:hypothetical protein